MRARCHARQHRPADSVLAYDRAADARRALTEQVTGTVQWVSCVAALMELGAEVFVEVGPGKVLSGLMRQIDREQKCLNVEDPASLEKTLAELG